MWSRGHVSHLPLLQVALRLPTSPAFPIDFDLLWLTLALSVPA